MDDKLAESAVEAAVAASGAKVVQVSAGAAIVSWIMSSEAGVILGLLLALLSAIVQFYFLRRRDKREEEEHRRRLANHASLRSDFTHTH